MSQPSKSKLSYGVLCNDNGEKYYLCEDQVSIGRDVASSICVMDVQVSRRHCIIEHLRENNSFTIIDISNHGTYLNGHRMNKNQIYPLNHRDKFSLSGITDYTYMLIINKKILAALRKTADLNYDFKEKITDLDSTHCDEMKKLTDQIDSFKKKKTLLNEELSSRLTDHENHFKRERNSLSNQISSSNEQKIEAEEKMKVMEATFATVQATLMKENENKLKEVAEREEQLKKSQTMLKEQYQKERSELEERFRIEVEALKEKLVESTQIRDRLKEETLEAEQKLKETKETLLQSELEQFRLHQEKVAVESKLESKMQESTSKEEMLKMLQNKLKEKEEEEANTKQALEELEKEIVCSICIELLIKPVVLNCGHVFCHMCIKEWKAKKKTCPMCRTSLKTSAQSHIVDSMINYIVKSMSAETQKRRLEVIKERSGGDVTSPKRRKTGHNNNVQTLPPHTLVSLEQEVYSRHHRARRHQVRQRATEPAEDFMWPTMVGLEPGPSTSAGVAAHANTPEQDPFRWRYVRGPPAAPRGVPTRTESPVTVAAIDLTHLNATASAAATATYAANTTIDLTTP